MTPTAMAIVLTLVSLACVVLGFLIPRWKTFLLVTAFFALLNSYISAPLNWLSFAKGYGFRLAPMTPTSPPPSLHMLALPTDKPEAILRKMGCYVCHKIPYIPESRSSEIGPVLIPETFAPFRLASPEYQARVKAGKAHAATPREYLIESILDPSAFIVPGYEAKENPERSMMFPHYDKRFTKGGLEVLVDYLLTLDVEDARKEGLIFAH